MAREIGQASPWRSETCAPRRSGSRGEASSNPSGASQSSWSSTIRSVSVTAFFRRDAIPASRDQLHPDPDRGEVEDRRRSRQEAADARLGVVGALHRELLALAEPAPDRRLQLLLQLLAHVEERGRARAGVQVLVGAADRQLHAPFGQLDRHDADRVREVP